MRASTFFSFFLIVTFGESLVYGIMEDVQDQTEVQLVIASGLPSDDARRTETFKWPNEGNSTCDLPDYPLAISGAVPVILQESYYGCGGRYPYTAQCFNLITRMEAPFNLLHERAYASSVTTKDTVFVFGGRNELLSHLASYEAITTDFVQTEGVMPFRWYDGCSTLVNNSTILLAGGFQDGTETAKTWFFNFETEEWTQGPSMIEERYLFGCGYIKSINSVAAFGGYYTATTEIVNLPGGSFHKVDDLPFELWQMSTVEDPTDSSSLVVSGGYDETNNQISASILKLTCASKEVCKWQVLNHKLKVPRYYHVSFFTNKPLNFTHDEVE